MESYYPPYPPHQKEKLKMNEREIEIDRFQYLARSSCLIVFRCKSDFSSF